MYGDGVVIRPMTKYKKDDMGFNERHATFSNAVLIPTLRIATTE